MTRLNITALVALLVSGPAMAQNDSDPYSGNYWHEQCSGTDLTGKALCIGYVRGLIEGLIGFAGGMYVKLDGAFHKMGSFYAPKSVTVGQYKDIFTNYLRDHPESRHRRAIMLFGEAVREAFCK